MPASLVDGRVGGGYEMRSSRRGERTRNDTGISLTEADYRLGRGGREMMHDMDWL